MRFIFRFWLLIAALFVAGFACSGGAYATEGKSPHITARLIAQSPTLPAGGDDWVAIDYTPAKGWHTYWLNPGDTGLAPKVSWDLPDGVTAGDVQFQPPVRLPTQSLMSYGYEGRNVLLVKLHNGSHFAAGDKLPLHATVDFLVCADVCVPESLTVSQTLTVGAAEDGPDTATVRKAIDGLPQMADLAGADAASVDINGDQVEFGFRLPHVEPHGAYFYPTQGD
ncbi:MAG: protein-disulfide reductase DsbD domain-containing protein, partial [Asticcacaulis sp.]